MQGVASTLLVGRVRVSQTPPGGCTPEQWADIVVGRILSISDQTCGVARLQAEAFRDALRAELVRSFTDALSQQRAGICVNLERVGLGEAAAAVRERAV